MIFRLVLLAQLLFVCQIGLAQSKTPDIDTIRTSVVKPFFSIHSQDSIGFFVGEKTLITQECTDKIPKSLVNHSIGFDEMKIQDILYKSAFYFKDTVLYRANYYFEGKNKNAAFQLFGLKRDDFKRQRFFEYYFSTRRDNVLVRCWFNRKQFFYEEKLIEVKTE